MKRSTLATAAILMGYIVVSGIIITAIAGSFGSDSVAMYIIVIAVGPVGLLLIATHKGLDAYLKGLDKHDE